MQKMADKRDKKIMLAAQFKLLADGSTHSLSVKAAMELAGFEKAEINSSTRAQENAIRRAYNAIKKKQPYLLMYHFKTLRLTAMFPLVLYQEFNPLHHLIPHLLHHRSPFSNQLQIKK